MRFVVELFDVVRDNFPAERPVWVRVSASDWVDGGWDLDSTVALAQVLKAHGCAAIDVSSGGVSPQQVIPLRPGYQVPFAHRVKAEVGLPTIAVGLITEAEQAEAIIADGEADAIAMARAMLYDPALAVACGGEARRDRVGPEAVLALAATGVQGPVRARSDRAALMRPTSLAAVVGPSVIRTRGVAR